MMKDWIMVAIVEGSRAWRKASVTSCWVMAWERWWWFGGEGGWMEAGGVGWRGGTGGSAVYWMIGCGAFAGDVLLVAYDDDHGAAAGERARATTHGPFSAAFLADRGLPSSLRRVRPRVFLNQLYICWGGVRGTRRREETGHASRKRRSDSSIARNSGGSPKRATNSAARSRANFLASPRTEPCERRSNSARLLGEDKPRRPTNEKEINLRRKASCCSEYALGRRGLGTLGSLIAQDRSHTRKIAVTRKHPRFHFPHITTLPQLLRAHLGFPAYHQIHWRKQLQLSLSVTHTYKHTHAQTLAWPPATSPATAFSSFWLTSNVPRGAIPSHSIHRITLRFISRPVQLTRSTVTQSHSVCAFRGSPSSG